MTSNAAKRILLVAAGGGTYLTAVYLTIQFMSVGQPEKQSAKDETDNKTSHILDPLRTQTFQRIAKAYDDDIGRDELVMGINLLRRALLHFHARGRVLEVGAGTGRNLDFYPLGENKVTHVILSDSSDQMLLRAKQKIQRKPKEEQERFQTLEANAAHLDMYADDSFDTIVDTFGLCSFDDPVAVLKELQRLCKPDGKILLLEHGRSKSYTGLSNYLDQNAERHAKNWGCVWNRDIDRIVRESGLQVDKLHTWHFGTTYYVVCRPGTKKQLEQAGGVATSDKPIVGDVPLLSSVVGRFFFVPTWVKCYNHDCCHCQSSKNVEDSVERKTLNLRS